MILPILLAAAAGFLLRHVLPIAWRMWSKAPEGHHVVKRGNKTFVRRNPKPKQLVEVPNE
jgi:hypothetical protein